MCDQGDFLGDRERERVRVSEEVIEIDKILEKMEIDKLLFHTQLHACREKFTRRNFFSL